MIERDIAPLLLKLAAQYPVVTLTGPRQSGKTTLARAAFPSHRYVSLEDPDRRAFATDDPRGFIASLGAAAVIDEVQRVPTLPSYLQGIVDQDATPGRFVITGSQQFELMSQLSQSLAGRSAVLRLLPFTLAEAVRADPSAAGSSLHRTLLTGGYPRIHDRRLDPSQALGDYFATYVERDLRELTAVHDLQRFERFVRLCAGRTGQLLNLAALGNDAGISAPTVRAWLDLLQTSYIVHVLQPWSNNAGKRLVKSPKLYFYDTGLACWLLGLRSAEQVARDPLLGALFENLVVVEALKERWNRGDTTPLFFYRDAIGNEIDLVWPLGSRHVHGIEVKAGATFSTDAYRGLAAFDKSFPDTLQSAGVVYGGDTDEPRSRWPVHSWRSFLRA